VSRDASAADVLRAAVATSVARLVRHGPVARAGNDPEGVHQARVATRRLRSDLRTFAPLLEEAWRASLVAELAWLAEVLGAARDADVLLERLRRRVREAETPPSPADRILGRLEERGRDAHRRLRTAMDSGRYRTLLDRLAEAAARPACTEAASGPAARLLPPLVRRRWRALRRAVAAAGPAPDPDALHRIRIRAKRARYAAEAVAPVVGPRADRFARAAAGVQEVLGEHHDAIVAGAWLRSVAAEQDGFDVAFALGVLAGLEDAAAARALEAWPAAWAALDRSPRGWMR
jgi:CHAD domain-containing protein